jgi:hypothetical protein
MKLLSVMLLFNDFLILKFKIVSIQLLWPEFKSRSDFGMCYIISKTK